ncbi:hypothetical protein Tco_1224959, partial [Tanacetum coccineum]
VYVPRSISLRESFDRVENVGFDLVRCYLCPSFIEGHTAKGVGLQVANSHIGNHREDAFTPLETIQRFLGVIGSRSLSGLEGRPSSRIEGEPSVDILREFLNLGPVGNWLTLFNRVPSEYPELLLEDNKLDKKSFKDVISQYVQEDPLYNLIATYPVNFQTFPDPIMYLAGLKILWEHNPKEPIMYYRGKEGIEGEIQFLPREDLKNKGGEYSSVFVNNETPVTYVEPLNAVAPSQFVETMADSDDTPSEKDEVV